MTGASSRDESLSKYFFKQKCELKKRMLIVRDISSIIPVLLRAFVPPGQRGESACVVCQLRRDSYKNSDSNALAVCET